MKSLEMRVEQVQKLLGEVRALVKICTLATKSCIIDEDLQMRDNTDYYHLLRRINVLLTNIRHTLDN